MRLRVMTYNILDGGLGREQLILRVLQSARPDIVLLQEVYHAETIAGFANRLGMEVYFAQGNTKRNLALLSRLPIINAESYHPSPIRKTLLEAELQLSSTRHLRVFGAHLVAFPFIGFEIWRQQEIRAILNRLESYRSSPYLIAGDLNSVAPNDRVAIGFLPNVLKMIFALQGGHFFRRAIQELVSAGLTDCFRELHLREDGFTFPVFRPNARLDYIFANEHLQPYLRQCYVVAEPAAVHRASDHLPVLAEFEIDDA